MSALRVHRWFAILSGLVATVVAGVALAANPAGFYYYDKADATYPNIGGFDAPTALLITGRCNRTNTHFTQARAAGAEVLAYINPVDILTAPSSCQAEFFTGAQLWPHKDANGNDRSEGTGTKLSNLTVGSSWATAVVAYVEDLMRDGNVDGVMLDVVGAKLWAAADWNNWPTPEQDEWTAGNIDLVRRINDSRKRINPFFIIINNNYWNPENTAPDPNVVYPGEQYVDGIVVEHHAATELNARAFAGRPYGSPGAGLEHRRVIAISSTSSDALAWTNVAGVTHVALQPNGYSNGEPPVVTPTPLTDRPPRFGRVDYGPSQSVGMTADFKRASKYALAQNGTLDALWAYLDGAAAASGMQEIRLVLYRDNNGVPGTKVTESNSKWLGAGAPGGWREFVVPHVALSQGNYWIGIFTGATGGVARNYSDNTKGNWYGNADTFSGGAESSFGAGNTGMAELSVFATYTVP